MDRGTPHRSPGRLWYTAASMKSSIAPLLIFGLLAISLATPGTSRASSGMSHPSLPDDDSDEVLGAVFATPQTFAFLQALHGFIRAYEHRLGRPEMVELGRTLARALILWPESLPEFTDEVDAREDQVVRILTVAVERARDASTHPAGVEFLIAHHLMRSLNEVHQIILNERYHSTARPAPLRRTNIARKLALRMGSSCAFSLNSALKAPF